MTDEAGLVVVGGGLSAVKTIERLRFAGYSDSITLLTDESVAPYDRPPLSKEFLTGDIDEAGLALLRPGSERELDVDVRLNSRVVRLDRAQKSVTLADGTTVPYGRLLIATGAKARRLDGMNPSPRIHYIRTIGDAVALGGAFSANVVKVLGWANDPEILNASIATVLVSEGLHDLSELVVENPHAASLQIPLPDETAMRDYLTALGFGLLIGAGLLWVGGGSWRISR